MEIQHHETAGGVVVDAQRRLLIIERDVERGGAMVHEVRLPKGHIDPGESEREAALREVREESGYNDLEITGDLGTAESRFSHGGREHHRIEHYFLMRPRSMRTQPQEPTPGSEEALFVPAWIPLEEGPAHLTYESEREFARRAIAHLGPA